MRLQTADAASPEGAAEDQGILSHLTDSTLTVLTACNS